MEEEVKVKEKTQVKIQTDRQDRILTTLERVIVKLSDNLEPVLTIPLSTPEEGKEETSLVPLASKLRENVGRTECVVGYINNLIDRLEL